MGRAGEAGGAEEEKLLIIYQYPMPRPQYSSDKTKTLVETAIYRVSKPTILYK
jgi:hypothetical protein